jgi:hypothetical protein
MFYRAAAISSAVALVLALPAWGAPPPALSAALEELRSIAQENFEARVSDPARAVKDGVVFCRTSIAELCLRGGRFSVIGVWRNPFDGSGVRVAGAWQLTYESGYMWFLSPSNVEVPIKILPFCDSAPAGFGIFAAGLTNFEVALNVKDLLTGAQRTYGNPAGQTFDTILDARALPCF